jgi:hypothetical protein
MTENAAEINGRGGKYSSKYEDFGKSDFKFSQC